MEMEGKCQSEYRKCLRDLETGKEVDIFKLGQLANASQGAKHNWDNCSKNRGHGNFILFGNFIKSDFNILPQSYREPIIFDFVKLLAFLTVKIQVSFVSKQRPDSHPRTGVDFHLKDKRGLRAVSHGTGAVVNVQRKDPATLDGSCPEGQTSGESRHECFAVTICTARHVVYDQSEASKSEITFTYFQEDGRKIAPELPKDKLQFTQVNADSCLLTFTTHEPLGRDLQQFLSQFQEKRIRATPLLYRNKEKALLPIVSHPHGQDKYISFGFTQQEVIHTYEELPDRLKDVPGLPELLLESRSFCTHGLVYNTPTCPGSSGAFVFHKDNLFKFLTGSVHEGTNDIVNYSGDNSDLEEHLRHVHRMPSKLKVKQRLKSYLKDVRNQQTDVRDVTKDATFLQSMRDFALDLPEKFAIEVAEMLDNTRAYNFRRYSMKVFKMSPPGSLALFIECFESIMTEMKKDQESADAVLRRFKELGLFKADCLRRFHDFDRLTGGPPKTRWMAMTQADIEQMERELAAGPVEPPKATAEELVKRSLYIQHNIVEMLGRMTDKKKEIVERLRTMIDGNKENLDKLFAQRTDDGDEDDTPIELEDWIDKTWDKDPSLLRRIYTLIEFNQ